jgi:hypothetical protein
MLKKAESRLRAIYDRDEFRAKRYRADWLPDSSGYTVLESLPELTAYFEAAVASVYRHVLEMVKLINIPNQEELWHEYSKLRFPKGKTGAEDQGAIITAIWSRSSPGRFEWEMDFPFSFLVGSFAAPQVFPHYA